MMKKSKKFLIVGHPRCGTGFSAKLLSSLGYKIGHEEIKKDGISSWFYVVNNEKYWTKNKKEDFFFQYIFCCLRHPFTALPSIALTETYTKGKLYKTNVKASYNIRKKHININENFNELNRAAQSYLGWYKLIENLNINCYFKIENGGKEIISFFEENSLNYKKNVVPLTQKVNTRDYKHPLDFWESLDYSILQELDEFCKKHDYQCLSELIK